MKLHLSDLLFALSGALDCVEREVVGVTTNHSKRVALLCLRLCRHLGLGRAELFDMVSCAVLHDNALTEYTLLHGRAKVQRLTDVEVHCTSGERNAAGFPFYGDTRNIILHHHENWDGSGYFGVQGTDISLRAAALRLADSLDLQWALGSGSPDLVQRARDHVASLSGSVYSPEIAAAFMDIFDDDMVRDLSHDRIDQVLQDFSDDTPEELSLDDLLSVCRIFSGITDAKSPHTATHCQGVAEKTSKLATHLHLEQDKVARLVIAAHLHDIGKLAIPANILEKPAALTPEEFSVMREHARMTECLLHRVRGLEEIALWAASHHEKVSGGGYPHGLRGPELPMESRLLACVDVYQALVENRPYRGGMAHDQAMTLLRRMGQNGALDATLVEHLDVALRPPRHDA